jgi:anti-sigma regulatory factor (Ser/Thr protein kinase)
MAGLRLCPAPAAVAVQQWVVVDATELRLLRAALKQVLDEQLLTPGRESDEVVDSVGIAATELASNAIRHAQSPAVVALSRNRETLILDVGDRRPSSPPRIPADSAGGYGGRGLNIVQQLAKRTGWYVADGGKHVWAQFSVPPASRRWHTPRVSVPGLGRFLRIFRRIGR